MFIHQKITSWGRLNHQEHRVAYPADVAQLNKTILNNPQPFLPYGMGRSYGDVCLNPQALLIHNRHFNHLIHFDSQTGVLTCEAGVLLKEIQEIFIPQNWSLPVTPGTQLVSVGGAIANDVHGKSHHLNGTFGAHVLSLVLMRSNGEQIECSLQKNADLFRATIGGLGLTGFIIQACLQLEKIPGAWLESENIPFETLDDFFELSQNSSSWAHSVAWIDCLNKEGKGIFMRGNFVPEEVGKPRTLSLSVPFSAPFSLINKLSLKVFNQTYYHLQKHKKGRRFVHYVPFFYPLDNVHHWNRLYGPKGFYQYQSVIPPQNAKQATQEMLKAIADSHTGSFLAVLKTFGNAPACGLLSFPQEGTTLALDFPNEGEKTQKLFERLDSIVFQANGRLYPAKDARMPRALFEAGFKELNTFTQFRDEGFSSAFSRRLMGF